MKIFKYNFLVLLITLVLLSCSKSEDDKTQETPVDPDPVDTSWGRVFTDDFASTASWTNWIRTNRFDYNSNYCSYLSSNPQIETCDGLSCLVLTASKNGDIWNSGHVKSNYSFKPATNQEFRVSASIKLVAMKDDAYVSFSNTYGAWPAFWTVQETAWPVNGEIDIMEGYSYGGTSKFASNLFYGTTAGSNQMGNSCTKAYSVGDGWHLYDEYWKNQNGTVTITIKLDEVTVATYTNAANSNLKLANFGPHNVILNLCVGDNYGNFTASKIDVATKTMMWVDYVTIDKRNL